MARKFRGTETSKVDGKGRMSIPAPLRRVFDAGDPDHDATLGRTQMVAVFGPPEWNWIELYTVEAIERIDAQIDAMPRGSRQRRWLERLMNGQSKHLEIDREGRIVLPQKLREKLGLGDNAETVLESRGDYVQLYHPDQPPAETLALEEFTRGFGPDFDPRSFIDEMADPAKVGD